MIWTKISMVILIASMLFKRADISVLDKKIISNFQCAEIGPEKKKHDKLFKLS